MDDRELDARLTSIENRLILIRKELSEVDESEKGIVEEEKEDRMVLPKDEE